MNKDGIKSSIKKALIDGMLDEKLYVSDMAWNSTSQMFCKSYEIDYQDPNTFTKTTIKPYLLYSVWQDFEGSMNYLLFFDNEFEPELNEIYGFTGVTFKNLTKEGVGFIDAVTFALL